MKSVTLNKDMKERMFHTFYRKATAEARASVDAKTEAFRDDYIDLLFGKYQKTLQSLPKPFRHRIKELAIPVAYKPPKAPKKRTKGKIAPTDKTYYSMSRLSDTVHLFPANWRPALEVRRLIDYVDMPEDSDVYGPTWESYWYRSWERFQPNLYKAKIITQDAFDDFAVRRFIPTCIEIDEVISEVEEAVAGVAIILKAARTTKSLLDQWPEASKYIELPAESKGSIARLVDIPHVNEVLAKTWPQEETA